MAETILDLRSMPDFAEHCRMLSLEGCDIDPRFKKLSPVFEWWRDAKSSPPPRSAFDPFCFGGALVGNLVLLDVLENGTDFRWRVFGGRHVEEFGADLTNILVSSLVQDHMAAGDLMAAMRRTVEDRQPVAFEIHYVSENKLLREAVGVFTPLADESGAVTAVVGAADWIKSRA